MTGRKPFAWVGGHPVADFVNTRAWYGDQPASERLQMPEDVVAWGVESGLLRTTDAQRMYDAFTEAAFVREEVMASALALRTNLHSLLHGLARDVPAPDVCLAAFNQRLATAGAATRLQQVPDARAFQKRPASVALTYEWLFHDLTLRTAELLTSDAVNRLRACGNDRCGWLFLDTSRNGLRRWCDMRVCGNRVKSRRRYAALKSTGEETPGL